MPTDKHIFLGTALWGWGIDKANAFDILDLFYERGGRLVDTAVNYPINSNPECFGLANAFLHEWIQSRQAKDLKVFCKIGSRDNSGGPECGLSPADLLLSVDLLRASFFECLYGIGVHWDNRTNSEEIDASLTVIQELHDDGIEVGFSGVQAPEIYARNAQLLNHWWIQVKVNTLANEAVSGAQALFPDANLIAYGINLGGLTASPPTEKSSARLRGLSFPVGSKELLIKLVSDHSWQPKPASLYQLALLVAWANPALAGFIIAPRDPGQAKDTLSFLASIDSMGNAATIWSEVQRALLDQP